MKLGVKRTVMLLWWPDNGKPAVADGGDVENNEKGCIEVVPAIEPGASAF